MMKEPRMKVPASTDFWVVFCRDESNGRTDSPLCVVPLVFFPRLGLSLFDVPLCFLFQSPVSVFSVVSVFHSSFPCSWVSPFAPFLLCFMPLFFVALDFCPLIFRSNSPGSVSSPLGFCLSPICMDYLWLL
ncbi:hypothetical protein NC652_016907 [Populus alba x Populus x berolinensis]|nr:hypothetical protein NC652_016907 [Populus alba x Populus x berolinensis]